MSEKILGEDLLYPHERYFGDFYCTTIKQLRLKSLRVNFSDIAVAAQLDIDIVRKLYRGDFNKPFVKYIEAVNKAINDGEITINS